VEKDNLVCLVKKRYSREDLDNIKELYEQEIPLKQIAEKFGRTTSSVRNKIHEMGWSNGGSPKTKEIQTYKEIIIRRYVEEKLSTTKIGKELGISDATVLKWLKRWKINTRNDQGRYSSVKRQGRFLEIDTPEKSYWLGYLYGDGSVNRKRTSLALHSTDIDHLCKFCDFMDESHNRVKMGNKASYVTLNSRCLCEDLISHGVVPNKTYEKGFKFPEKFQRDFLRGLVDSDGHIQPQGRQCQISGTHHHLNIISQYLTQNDFHHKIYKGSSALCFQIIIMRKKNVQRFLRYIYDKATIYLDRKFTTYRSIIAPLDSDI